MTTTTSLVIGIQNAKTNTKLRKFYYHIKVKDQEVVS
jgi:hypothetical protein